MKKSEEKVINSLSANARRELEVLSHYCDIDYKNKIVTVPSHFNSIYDFISLNTGNKEHPLINDDIFQNMSAIIHSIPDSFNVSFEFVVDRYEGYKPNNIMNGVQDSLEIFGYNVKKQMNANGIKKSLLLAAGIIIFSWLFIICSLKIFGEEEIMHNIAHEIIYTVACVLLWEGIYILFLPDKTYNDISYDILKKIHSISFYNKSKKLLLTRSLKELKHDWIHETPMERRFRSAFLISATGYFCLALCSLPEIIPLFKYITTEPMSIVILISTAINTVILLLTAVAELSFYNGSGPLKKHTIIFNIISLVLICSNLSIHIANNILFKKTDIFWFVISAFLIVASVIGLCGAIVLSKKKK